MGELEVDFFFHGTIDRDAAECRLMLYSNQDGTFLIRSKDEVNYVISVWYNRRIAHYLIVKEADGSIKWDAERTYTSLSDMITAHMKERNGMITELTTGCPVREFVVQDSLFPGHECAGLCWFHGRLSPEEIQLRLAVVEPFNGAFLITNGRETLYEISIWIEGKVVQHEILELDSKQLCITLEDRFSNLLDLIRFYQSNDTLGHSLTRPCCVSVWQQRGHLSHPPQILSSLVGEGGFSDSDEDGRCKITRKLAFKARRRAADLVDLSSLALSDDETSISPRKHDGIAFYNKTFNSDEESPCTKTDNGSGGGVTLETHNTLSRKGSNRIKRKSMEKAQRQRQKSQQSAQNNPPTTSSSSEDGVRPPNNLSNLRRRNAGEKKRNKKKAYLGQGEVEQIRSGMDRMTLDPNSILTTDHIGDGLVSKVYKGTLHHVPVAIKRVNRSRELPWVHTVPVLEHDNIARLIGYEHERMIVTEFCELGSLDQYLQDKGQRVISPLNILVWLRDIANALLHLQEAGVHLRALSCRNILLNGAQCAKLSLYSTSRLLCDLETDKVRWVPADRKPCPVWSFGVTLLEALLYGAFKLNDLKEIRYHGGIPIIPFPNYIPLAVRTLIKNCLKQKASERPSLRVIRDKLLLILDIIIKAYSWKIKDSALLQSLHLEALPR